MSQVSKLLPFFIILSPMLRYFSKNILCTRHQAVTRTDTEVFISNHQPKGQFIFPGFFLWIERLLVRYLKSGGEKIKFLNSNHIFLCNCIIILEDASSQLLMLFIDVQWLLNYAGVYLFLKPQEIGNLQMSIQRWGSSSLCETQRTMFYLLLMIIFSMFATNLIHFSVHKRKHSGDFSRGEQAFLHY